MQAAEILTKLKAQGNAENVKGMAKFGINSTGTLGVSMPFIRSLGKEVGVNHDLALALWDSKIHEARILAGLVDDPSLVSRDQMEKWAKEFDSWDVCDQCCINLFDKTNYAYLKAVEWAGRKEEFVKRAGFALMAVLAVHDKEAPDASFRNFLPIIARESLDCRNYVKKAVSWALRSIGKRNDYLGKEALATAKEISCFDSASARWIASDALRELEKASFSEGKKAAVKKKNKKKSPKK